MEFKSNTKQRNKSIQGLRSFKNTLPTKIRRIIKKKGKIYEETIDNWRYIVGDEFFKVCYPKSFKSSSRLSNSGLSVMVKRGHEVDIEYSKDQIIQKMNKFFGYKVVEKIKLITFEDEEKFSKKIKKNMIKNKYTDKISDIKNDKIKNALKELGNYISKK
tara:strand:+ start:171 stop:650 length:480 start_codon:yes stop_codon:yes gene_type:complete